MNGITSLDAGRFPGRSPVVATARPFRACHLLAAVWCVALLVMPAASGIAKADDEPEIRVAVSAKEIYIGESVDYQVELRNFENPTPPDMSAIKEMFDVVATGDQSRNQSSTFIINGVVSQQNVFSHVYQFRLTPRSTGDLVIPAAKSTIDGKTLTGARLPLRVDAAEVQDDVIVEIQTSHTQVYPTQPFSVTLRVLVRPLPNEANVDPLRPLRQAPPHLQINWVEPLSGLATDDKAQWLQPLLSDDAIGFTLNDITMRTGSFFDGPRSAVFNLSKGRETRDGLDGKPIRYFNYELARTFTPEKTGVYSLGPATVKGTFVVGVEDNQYKPRRLVAIAPAVSIEVREVPSPRPATYCGGIGDYQIAASASPTTLRVGDPLTLTLELTRGPQSGSLELIAAPDLSAIPKLADDFDLIDKSPTGRIEGSVKRFAYAMRPRKPNVSIPALTVNTFDPELEKFTEIRTEAIPLTVSEAQRISGSDLVGSRPSAGSSEIKTRAQGIFQNITDPSELRDERISLVAWGVGAASAWSLAGLLIAAVAVYRRKSADIGWSRRQQARRSANRQLAAAREALSRGESREALRQVRSAIIGLIADMRNRVAEGLTTADAEAVLTAAAVPTDERAAVIGLLEAIESAEYGGGPAGSSNTSIDTAASIETAASLIARIAPHLERGA